MYVTYHEWAKHIKDALLIEESRGKFGDVAKAAGIQPERLRRWLDFELYLSHAEFVRLHETLAETHVLGSEADAVSKIEEARKSLEPLKPHQCGCSNCEDNDISFDQSD